MSRQSCGKCGKKLSPALFYAGDCYRIQLRCCTDVLKNLVDHEDVQRYVGYGGQARQAKLEGHFPRFETNVKYALFRIMEESWLAFYVYWSRSPYKNTRIYRVGDNQVGMSYEDDKGIKKTVAGRPARIFKKLVPKKDMEALKASEVELFHNLFEGALRGSELEWKIVQGEKIRDWYYERSYESGCGYLNDSCMRYRKSQPYLDLYVKNKKVCKLLTVRSKETGKLHGRALVWKMANGRVFMDKPYANDILRPQMFAYAHERGWETDQNTVRSYVQLHDADLDHYPYLDTFRYFEVNTGRLHVENYVNGLTHDERMDIKVLEETDGTSYRLVDDDEYEIPLWEQEAYVDAYV